MKPAIIGSTGKVGRATARTLRVRDVPVRAVVRDGVNAGELAAWGCEIAVADLRDPDKLSRAIAGADAVQVICPLSPRGKNAEADAAASIEAIATALEAARPTSIVAISDYGAEHPSGTGVTVIFHHLERRLGRLPAAVTFVRSAEHMQNWARLAGAAVETGILPSLHHPTTKLFPTVSAPDVGVISADLLLSPGEPGSRRVVYVEGPRRYTPRDVAATLARLAGREIVARELPRSDWMSALRGAGLGQSYAQLIVELHDAHNAGRIEVEAGGEVRRGTTELREALAGMVR